jgi:hypothetical protein
MKTVSVLNDLQELNRLSQSSFALAGEFPY